MIAFLKTTAAGSLSGLLFGWSLFGWSSSPAPPRVSAWAVDWSASVLRDSLRSLEQGNGAIAEVDLFRWRLSPEGQLADTGAHARPSPAVCSRPRRVTAPSTGSLW